mgnify:CR=1 FL=1
MDKLKLMTVVGTRPELIRLSEIIKKADVFFEHTFVHTGQNYDPRLNDIFYEDLGVRKPDYYLGAVGSNVAETIGNIIIKSYQIMEKIRPDAVLILGDTNSALCAISAKRLKIPIFHMEAGNRCFDENLPEETNRRIVDHISDVNLPYTEHARRYLLTEGVAKERIYVTGSPMREVIKAHEQEIINSKILTVENLEKRKYIVLSAHREENIDIEAHFLSLMNSVNALAEEYGVPVIYSVHPRSAKFIEERNFAFHELVRKMPPYNFTDYSALMRNAMCVVSDSGTMPEEAAVEHFPAVCIRTSTERPEAVDRGAFIIGNISRDSIIQSVNMAVKMSGDNDYGEEVLDYAPTDVSGSVIRIIQGYVPIINDRVWRKNG